MLLATLIVRAIRKDRREYQQFKRLMSSAPRQRMMRKWLRESFVLFGATSAVLLVLSWQFIAPLLVATDHWIPIHDLPGFAVGIAVGVIGAGIVGSVLAIFVARTSDEVPTIGDVSALLPRNREELVIGALLSVNAGVVEELMFRLALPAAIFGLSGNAVVAVVASLLAFGILHVYQGWVGVVSTTVLGAIFMALYLGTGSIAVPIIAHALVDLRSLVLIPVVIYGAHRKSGDAAPDTLEPAPVAAATELHVAADTPPGPGNSEATYPR